MDSYQVRGKLKKLPQDELNGIIKGQHEDLSPQSSGPYRIEGGRIVRERMTKDGPVVESLCNFNAWIDEEVVLDDGAEATRAFQIKGELETGLTLPAVRIPASRFAYMNVGNRIVGNARNRSRGNVREGCASRSDTKIIS